MNILAKYIHGSEDSIDKDVYYVVDELPSFQECKEFCDTIKDENANLITIKNYRVDKCYKGVPDECNNSLLSTYELHQQEYQKPNIIFIQRDKGIKYIRTIRIILSHLSRTQYRPSIKKALKSGDFLKRLNILSQIDFKTINFEKVSKKETGKDILKVIAFQIGQATALLSDIECYTKSTISKRYHQLKPFLYREDNVNFEILNDMVHEFCQSLYFLVKNNENGIVTFLDNTEYDIINEKRIK